MHTHSSAQELYPPFCQQLAHRYDWRLLDLQTWSANAAERYPAAMDNKVRQRACLHVYAAALHRACQEPARREQAYGELYNYLWWQAHWRERDPDLANDAVQEAIILVQRSFVGTDLKPCRKPSEFLYFATMKIRDALKMLRRRYRVNEEIPESDLPEPEDGSGLITRQPDHRASPVEKERWWRETIQATALEVLDCLDDLWDKKDIHTRLTSVMVTYMDQTDDENIAQRLNTNPKNVEVLRSRGLGDVRKHLIQRGVLEEIDLSWMNK